MASLILGILGGAILGFTFGAGMALRISDRHLRKAQFDLDCEKRYSRWAGRRIVRFEPASWGTVDSLTNPPPRNPLWTAQTNNPTKPLTQEMLRTMIQRIHDAPRDPTILPPTETTET